MKAEFVDLFILNCFCERLAKLKEAAATASPAKKARGRSKTHEAKTEDAAGPAEVEKIKASCLFPKLLFLEIFK